LSLYKISLGRLAWRKIAIAAVAIVGSIFLIDRLCGLLAGPDDQSYRLVLPPSETARYEFRDFQFTVSTNRLGFRGPDFPIHRTPGLKRILVFGNSGKLEARRQALSPPHFSAFVLPANKSGSCSRT
jgi:hypothetical protein